MSKNDNVPARSGRQILSPLFTRAHETDSMPLILENTGDIIKIQCGTDALMRSIVFSPATKKLQAIAMTISLRTDTSSEPALRFETAPAEGRSFRWQTNRYIVRVESSFLISDEKVLEWHASFSRILEGR